MRPLLLASLLCLGAVAVQAQWVNYPTPGLPRGKDGKVLLNAPAPRAKDGKPDLSGVWHVQPTGLAEMKRLFGNDVDALDVPGMEAHTISKYGISVLIDFTPGESPLRKDVAAEVTKANRHESGLDNLARCLPGSIPLATMLSEFTKIVQTPGLTLVMHELDNATRQVYTDGRPFPADPNPSWLGYSTGGWERDTLVVETIGFNGKAPLDIAGNPRSERMRITERYRRRDVGHLDVDITFEDPVIYTRPFTIKVTHELQPDTDVLEYFCNENEKDQIHILNAK
ncbi:MAG TPA: hypothetical protein VFD69_08865 [Vicinamibacterales bacterium]|nr:hypothetical protein [Vicinamibacterales bacterium]